MSEKHEVTVYDRAPATAAVSVRQLEAFLVRKGWAAKYSMDSTECGIIVEGMTAWLRERERHEDPIYTSPNMTAAHIAGVVDRIAMRLRVQPSAVLADIAKEPES